MRLIFYGTTSRSSIMFAIRDIIVLVCTCILFQQGRRTSYDVYLAIVPVTVLSSEKRADTDVPFHPSYNGVILFQNAFNGKLPASDYPKVNVRNLCFRNAGRS